MFAQFGRRRADIARGPAHVDRLADHVHLAVCGRRDRRGKAQMLDLRVIEHLVDRVDGSAGHAALVEEIDPLGAVFRLRVFRDFGVQRVAVL